MPDEKVVETNDATLIKSTQESTPTDLELEVSDLFESKDEGEGKGEKLENSDDLIVTKSEETPIIQVEPDEKINLDHIKPIEKIEIPAPSVELETLKSQIGALTALVEKLSGGDKKVEIPPIPTIGKLEDFFKDLDFDSAMESKENFIKFMASFAETIQNSTKQDVLTAVPNYMGEYVTKQASLKDIREKFDSDHPNLTPVKRYVGSVAESISTEHPDWTVGQVLDEAAKKSYETLGISQTKVETPSLKTVKKPSLPGGTGGIKVKAPVSGGLMDEINELISD